MISLRQLRRALSGASHNRGGQIPSAPPLFGEHRRRFEHTYTLVRVFYALQLMYLVTAFRSWNHWLGLEQLDGLWPLVWGSNLAAPLVASQVVVLYALGTFSAILWPHRWMARALLFVGLLQRAALDNSFGKIDHGFHAWIYVSFVLIFLPDGSVAEIGKSIAKRQRYLLVWAGAQASFLMLYSLAGWWKVYFGVQQALHGQMGVFSPRGFAYMTADRLLQTHSDSVLGPLIIELGGLGGVLLWAGIYVELMSLVVIFRPALLRFWGLALASLHLGTELVLTIGFDSNIVLGAVLLIASPSVAGGWPHLLRQLPLFGWPLGKLLDRRTARSSA